MKGNMYNLLGMKTRYLNNKRVSINMKKCILEAIQDFGEDVSHIVTFQAEIWMSTVVKGMELQGKRLDMFHYLVMELLWILQWGGPDFSTVI